MKISCWTFIIALFHTVQCSYNLFRDHWEPNDNKYGYFPEEERVRMLDETRKMFQFGWDNYMKYAFPKDELNPIFCEGRGPDYDNPSNININDVLGDFSLTLVDTLDTLAIMGNSSEFKRAVDLVIQHVNFDKPNTVQVFEATIRILGALISAHLIVIDPKQPFGDMVPDFYDNELLELAHDVAGRLLPAFEDTLTGMPYPRINLLHGVPFDCINETCTAGVGTLLLEFGILSKLLDDPVYESVAKRALSALWSYRSNVTGLFGNVINIQTGEWIGQMSGLGAGIDSFYEYLFKAYIMFGDESYLAMFNESYENIKSHMRKGRAECNQGRGNPPLYVNVNMQNGETSNNWIDALQASWPANQVLNGDIEEAICSHAVYYAIWRKYGALPERYNWHLKAPDVTFYPLRPELVESTYILYQATKNPFYLHVGKDILNSLNNHTKAECGYATIHNVNDKDLEDRMESFFLSETCKYLYLLFDKDNYINKNAQEYLFTTEGHILPVKYEYRKHTSNLFFNKEFKSIRRKILQDEEKEEFQSDTVTVDARNNNSTLFNCKKIPEERRHFLPIKNRYLQQLELAVGLDID
ncbi:unnamed protein product [Owenia fusiformis]|uniref:alpha-1,2-Mannosidase n=1 Tax=Owenia fusiformis TaxID=6347 RepID=A0A8S4NP15_OWEFU|nr:unnamed protein product [Owenia fusiformis]